MTNDVIEIKVLDEHGLDTLLSELKANAYMAFDAKNLVDVMFRYNISVLTGLNRLVTGTGLYHFAKEIIAYADKRIANDELESNREYYFNFDDSSAPDIYDGIVTLRELNQYFSSLYNNGMLFDQATAQVYEKTMGYADVPEITNTMKNQIALGSSLEVFAGELKGSQPAEDKVIQIIKETFNIN